MELNTPLVRRVVLLSSRISKAKGKKTYLSEAMPTNNEQIHVGKRGAKYFYRLGNEPTTDQKDGSTFIPRSHGQFRRILMNEGSEARLNILNHLYGHPSYAIKWTKISNYDSGDSRVEGILYSNGEYVGDIQRRFRANKTVFHEKLELSDSLPQGIATEMNDRAEEIYRKMGYKKVVLDADITIGKYAWARQGYNWTYASRLKVLSIVKHLFSSDFLEYPDAITIGDGFYEKLNDTAPLFDWTYGHHLETRDRYLKSIDDYTKRKEEVERKLENFSNSEGEIELLLQTRSHLISQIEFNKRVLEGKNQEIKRYIETLPKGNYYRRTDSRTGRVTKVDPNVMKKKIARHSFSQLMKNNNNLRYSWDLAKAENGRLYKNYNDPDSKEEFPLGKALMLSLPKRGSWTGVKQLDKKSINYEVGRAYAAEKRKKKK